MKLVPRSRLAVLAALAAPSLVASQDFAKQDMGCVAGSSGPGCPRRYRVTGGPGYVGHRAQWEMNGAWETSVFCSPSCVPGSASALTGECGLTLAFHGIYSSPGDQIWLMMGSDHAASLGEDEADGGPFCVSFHKSKGDGWEGSCAGDDADHIEGFIHWALDEFPTLDPDAVNLHGFSSGAIQTLHLMDTSCPVESLVAAAAPYAGGYISSPPTTKAAFIIAHGTHDNIVPYEEGWNYDAGTAVPTCGINDPTFFNNFAEFSAKWKSLFAETITAGVARYRGYTGDVYDPIPAASGSVDLIDEAGRAKTCNAVLGDCVNRYNQPSPWNDGFSCADLPDEETDVVDFPVSPGSAPVRLLKINIHNHDYPNRRRSAWGPTEFFLYLRRFFHDSRGARPPKAPQTVEELAPGQICADPDLSKDDPSTAYKRIVLGTQEVGGMTAEVCSERCRADEECVEAFFVDYNPYHADVGCHLHFRFLPCASTKGAFSPARHFTTSRVPTPPPVPAGPTTPLPTRVPTAPPTNPPTPPPTSLSFCPAGESLLPGNPVGYACLDASGASVLDSNAGGTDAECGALGGTWTPYDCATADSFWLSMGGWAYEHAGHFGPIWAEACCTRPPTPSPTGFCPAGTLLIAGNSAGYSCLEGLGDSNVGTTEADCADLGGTWTPYDCGAADTFWLSSGGHEWEYADAFEEPWASQCCTGGPTPPPTPPPSPPPTNQPTPLPSPPPTVPPTPPPTNQPTTPAPTPSPEAAPVTPSPTNQPTPPPSPPPTVPPTPPPTVPPTPPPTNQPTTPAPTPSPEAAPVTPPPTSQPTPPPSPPPTVLPTVPPTVPPTPPPTPPPTNQPTPVPTNQPTPPPSSSLDFCPASDSLLGQYFAGYSCLEGLGDSNVGTTEQDCAALGGTWVPYTCTDADSFYKSVGGSAWEYASFFEPAWSTQCCSPSGAMASTADIGYVAIPGDTSFNAGSETTTINASGGDIWGTQDGFRFAYQTLEGDGTIRALVHPPSRTNEWAKNGIMLRESLAAGAANAFILVTADYGVLAQHRPSSGAQSAATHLDWVDRTTPIWLKITRVGGRYISFHRSEDGTNWSQVGGWMDIPMGTSVYVGVAATAHNNGAIVSAPSQYFTVA